MTTARRIIRGALTDIQVASSEEPIQASMAEDALDLLNALLDSWARESVMIYCTPPTVLPWPAGAAQRLWGPGGDIVTPRPLRLQPYATYRDGDEDRPLTVLTRQEEYTQIALKGMQSTMLQALYYEPTMPTGTLYSWPTPSQGWDITVYPWVTFGRFPHLDDEIQFPPGYERALRLNLGIECAPQYGVQPGPTRERLAWEAKTALVPLNAVVGRLKLTPGATVGGDSWSRFVAGRP